MSSPLEPPAVLSRLQVERFEYVPAALLVRLRARLPADLLLPARTQLVIERDPEQCAEISPLISCIAKAPAPRERESLWRAAFPVELDLESGEPTSFYLRSHAGALFALPQPRTLAGRAQPPSRWPGLPASRRGFPYVARCTALALVVSCQFTLAPGVSAVAFGDGSEGSSETPTEHMETPPSASGEGQSESPSETEHQPPPEGPAPEGPAHGEPPPPTDTSGEHEQAPPQPQGEAPHNATPPSPSFPSPAPASSAPPAQSATGASSSQRDAQTSVAVTTIELAVHAPPGSSRRAGDSPAAGGQQGAGGGGPAHRKGQRKGKRRVLTSRDPQPAPPAPPAPQPLEGDADDSAAPPPGTLSEVPQALVEVPAGVTAAEIQPPAYLIPIYKEAGHRYKVPWRILAAINQVESDYGRDLSTSPAGAMGWMQFMPETWRPWAVDADGDEYADPYSPRDAIFTAARYLQASGAERDLPGAIFAYNHAAWYVAEVLFRADRIDTSALALETSYALPLDARYMSELGRTDDGVDVETAPDGAPVFSMTPGVVTAVASDPTGFGPNYPVIEVTAGPLAGQHIYYGHVAQSLVVAGEHVAAGEPIAIMGHAGDASSLGHGHIEIGFCDEAGDPLSHHGASAWTPSGEIMREFLVSLAAVHHVHDQ